MKRKGSFKVLILLLILPLLFGCKKESEEISRPDGMESDVVTIGIQANPQFLPLYVAKEKKYIEDALHEYGISVVWNEYNMATPLSRSLNGGICDIGIMGDVPAVIGITSYQKISIVGNTCTSPGNYVMVVRADSEINEPSDLAGKRVGTVYGSTAHLYLKKYLENAGLSLSDIELLDISVGNTLSYLNNNEVDVVVTWEPHAARTIDLGAGRYLSMGDETDLYGGSFFVSRNDFAEKNYNTLKIIMEMYDKAAGEVFNIDPELFNDVATDLSINKDQLEFILKRYDYSGVKIEDKDIKGLQETIDFLYDLNIITEKADAKSIMNQDIL